MTSQRQSLPDRYWNEDKIAAVLIQLFPSNREDLQDFCDKQKRVLRTNDSRKVFDICVSKAFEELLEY
jgi:hypothetical protein